jgi:hypothetical protein
MATAARNLIVWSRDNRPIYAPGAFGGAVNVVTLPLDQESAIELQASGGGLIFGHSSMSHGFEARQLTEYFVKYVVRSMEGLADPYGSASGEDPFEYRSVPYRQGRTIRAKVEWIGSIPPSPIDDD